MPALHLVLHVGETAASLMRLQSAGKLKNGRVLEAAESHRASISPSSSLTELGFYLGWQFAQLKDAIPQTPLKLSVAMKFSSDRSAKCGMEL